MNRVRFAIALAAVLSAVLVAGCGSASTRLPADTLDALVARQAAAYVARPGFAARAASVMKARSGAGRMTASQARSASYGFAALTRAPLSAYACSPTSSARRSSAAYRCTMGGSTNGMATATCDVSTGRCRQWHVGVLVITTTLQHIAVEHPALPWIGRPPSRPVSR